jgi:hypothetical protein
LIGIKLVELVPRFVFIMKLLLFTIKKSKLDEFSLELVQSWLKKFIICQQGFITIQNSKALTARPGCVATGALCSPLGCPHCSLASPCLDRGGREKENNSERNLRDWKEWWGARR